MSSTPYPAVFEDARGREEALIHNDGQELRITLRGITFAGSDFDGLAPVDAAPEQVASLFILQRGDLCSFELRWTMQVAIVIDGVPGFAPLKATLVLGDPLPNGCLTGEDLQLELQLPSGPLRSSGKSGWFEDELLELAKALGSTTRLRSCLTCAYSDYSPYGHGLFGDLACFRTAKAAYSAVEGKLDLFEVWGQLTEYVQETHCCEEQAPRVPGTGYRG